MYWWLPSVPRATNDKKLFLEFRQMIGGSNVYPDPLELNLEPTGDQDFLEARVFGGTMIRAQLNNKVYTDIRNGLPPYRQRFSGNGSMSRRYPIDQAHGVMVRCLQTATTEELLTQSMLQLRYELVHFGVPDSVFQQALARVLVTVKRIGSEAQAEAMAVSGS